MEALDRMFAALDRRGGVLPPIESPLSRVLNRLDRRHAAIGVLLRSAFMATSLAILFLVLTLGRFLLQAVLVWVVCFSFFLLLFGLYMSYLRRARPESFQ